MKNIRRIDLRNFLKIDNFNYKTIADINKLEGIDDPTFLTLGGVWFDCDTDLMTPGSSSFSNLLLPPSDVNSAINYLKRINKRKESAYLEEFREQILNLQKNKQWYFQTINGLNELMLLPAADSPYRREKDKKITIETLESFDMRIHFLADLYHKATYDMVNKRFLLPRNMKRFNMKIIVTEVRDLFELIENINEVDNTTPNQITQPEESYKNYLTNLKQDSNSWLSKMSDNINITEGNVYKENDFSNSPVVTRYNEMNTQVESNKKYSYKLQTIQDRLTYKVFELYFCEFDFNKFPAYETLSVATTPEMVKMGFDIIPGLNFTTTQYGFLEWVVCELNKNYKTNDLKYINNNSLEKFENIPWHIYTHRSDEVLTNRNANLDEISLQDEYLLENDSEEAMDAMDAEMMKASQSSPTKKSAAYNYFQKLKDESKQSAAKYLNEYKAEINKKRLDSSNRVKTTISNLGVEDLLDPESALNKIKKSLEFTNSKLSVEKFDYPDSKNRPITEKVQNETIIKQRNITENISLIKEFNQREINNVDFIEKQQRIDLDELSQAEPKERIDLDELSLIEPKERKEFSVDVITMINRPEKFDFSQQKI